MEDIKKVPILKEGETLFFQIDILNEPEIVHIQDISNFPQGIYEKFFMVIFKWTKPLITPKIFLSYVQEDKQHIIDLYRKLSNLGYKPWMDSEDINIGEDWQLSIRNAIKKSDFFLVCLSSNSNNKRSYFQKELKIALEIHQENLANDIYIIPVRLVKCEVPECLHRFQYVDIFEDDGWPKLLKSLQIGMNRKQYKLFENNTNVEIPIGLN